jgi:hypothetical protein
MARCPSCDYPLPNDRERLGARCPNCRDPLYEPPERIGRPAREGEGACAVHAGQEAVGTCARCGNYFCEVCRTRWRDQVFCAACVERALAAREADPGQTRRHFRQALLGLLLGGGAWVSLILIQPISLAGTPPALMGLLVLFLCAVSGLMGVMGLGQSTAVLRTCGHHMILGMIGLIVSGLYVGVFIGLFAFLLWYI